MSEVTSAGVPGDTSGVIVTSFPMTLLLMPATVAVITPLPSVMSEKSRCLRKYCR